MLLSTLLAASRVGEDGGVDPPLDGWRLTFRAPLLAALALSDAVVTDSAAAAAAAAAAVGVLLGELLGVLGVLRGFPPLSVSVMAAPTPSPTEA